MPHSKFFPHGPAQTPRRNKPERPPAAAPAKRAAAKQAEKAVRHIPIKTPPAAIDYPLPTLAELLPMARRVRRLGTAVAVLFGFVVLEAAVIAGLVVDRHGLIASLSAPAVADLRSDRLPIPADLRGPLP